MCSHFLLGRPPSTPTVFQYHRIETNPNIIVLGQIPISSYWAKFQYHHIETNPNIIVLDQIPTSSY